MTLQLLRRLLFLTLGMGGVVGTLLLFTAVSHAYQSGQTWHVASNGIDGPTCGTIDAPCRSISQAISLANAGGTLLVGPGRYGDVNADGTFDDPGDEAAESGDGCSCIVKINKPVTVLTTHGAGATLIDAPITPFFIRTVVHIATGGVVLGGRRKGFSVVPAMIGSAGVENGIVIDAPSGSIVGGNYVTGARGYGIRVLGAGHAVLDNVVRHSAIGISVSADSVELVRNDIANSGIEIAGSGHTVRLNTIIGTIGNGLWVVGNNHTIRRNSFLGSHHSGVILFTGSAVFRENNIFGNTCGVTNASGGSVNASGNYWGAASGPGPDPADHVCDTGDSVTTTSPPATEPFTIRR